MKPGMMALFLGVALGFWSLLNLYCAMRLVRDSGLAGHPASVAWALFAVSWLTPPIALFLWGGNLPPGSVGWVGLWIAYAFVGLMGILFPFLLARDILWFVGWVVRLMPRDPLNRQWVYSVSCAVVAGAAIGCAGAAAIFGARDPRVVTVDLPVRNLPAAFEGFKIAFYSDLHLGAVCRRSLAVDIARKVNALDPDVAVLGGDLADGKVSALGYAAAPLGGIKARSGKFFVTGNHEYFRDYQGWLSEVKKLGYVTLTNEHRVITRGRARIVIGGIPDYYMSIRAGVPSDPAAAIRRAPRAAVCILISHNPQSAPEAGGCGWDYQISGHTHGGQFFPWTIFFGKLPFYWPGWHTAGRMRVWVNQGAGSWGPPFRLGTFTEITLFRLVRAN